VRLSYAESPETKFRVTVHFAAVDFMVKHHALASSFGEVCSALGMLIENRISVLETKSGFAYSVNEIRI